MPGEIEMLRHLPVFTAALALAACGQSSYDLPDPEIDVETAELETGETPPPVEPITTPPATTAGTPPPPPPEAFNAPPPVSGKPGEATPPPSGGAAPPPVVDTPPPPPAYVLQAPESDDWLITDRGLGPLTGGRTVGDFIAQMPNAAVRFHENYIVDFSGVCLELRREEVACAIVEGSARLDTSARVEQLTTSNPRFRTAEGVGPGVPLSAVEPVWGEVTLAYSTDNESRESAQFADGPLSRVYWRTHGPGDANHAGSYESEGAYNQTHSYVDGAYIESIWAQPTR